MTSQSPDVMDCSVSVLVLGFGDKQEEKNGIVYCKDKKGSGCVD